jgi:hypothetical protein
MVTIAAVSILPDPSPAFASESGEDVDATTYAAAP